MSVPARHIETHAPLGWEPSADPRKQGEESGSESTRRTRQKLPRRVKRETPAVETNRLYAARNNIAGRDIATGTPKRTCSAAADSDAAVITPSPSKKSRSTAASGFGRKSLFPALRSPSYDTLSRDAIQNLIRAYVGASDVSTETLGGWCLVDGLTHCASASGGILASLIKQHGPPTFLIEHLQQRNTSSFGDDISDASANDRYRSFRSLCRIVSGQQLAGKAASTIWRRLLAVVGSTEDDTSRLTPDRILSLAQSGSDGDMETNLRAPAGLSKAKCNCIIEIARNYEGGTLSDEFLLGRISSDEEVRSRLLDIKGLGPWSVDMFLLFQCHRSNVLPIGDLAVRNGTANLWRVKGKAKGGGLCQKKDAEKIRLLHEPFAPYRSISSYYMYKCSGMKG